MPLFIEELTKAVLESRPDSPHADAPALIPATLRDSLVAALASGATVPELRLAVVAMYFPLHTLPGAEALVNEAWSEESSGAGTLRLSTPVT